LGADPNARDNSDNTPLHLASKIGHHEVAEILLDRGVDTNARNNDNAVPLHFASKGGHLEVVRKLLDRHADVNARDKNYNTPLHSVLKMPYVSTDALDLHVNANTKKGLARLHD
jgi:cytohesin